MTQIAVTCDNLVNMIGWDDAVRVLMLMEACHSTLPYETRYAIALTAAGYAIDISDSARGML